jgi:hypothetical protein
MALRELQQRFQAQVLGQDDGILASIAGTAPLTPARRMAIYREAYGARLREALKASYVKLHLVLGDETFAALAADYLAAHPSTRRSIRWFGDKLAAHLQSMPPWSGQPILAELARFEWALTECFDAADAGTLTRADLAQVDPQRWGELHLAFHPAVRTLSLAWNAVDVWKALDADEPPPAPQRLAAETTWLVWRQKDQNRFRSIDEHEATALAWAMDGASFAEVCEQLAGVLSQEQVPLAAATLLTQWLDAGVLIRR